MSTVFSFSTRRSSWLVTSTKRITSSIVVSRTNTVTRRSGGTSRSKTKLRPLRFEISSNTVRTGASRSSMVMVFFSAAASCGLVASAFTLLLLDLAHDGARVALRRVVLEHLLRLGERGLGVAALQRLLRLAHRRLRGALARHGVEAGLGALALSGSKRCARW